MLRPPSAWALNALASAVEWLSSFLSLRPSRFGQRTRGIAFVGQMEISDCGAACLTMVLGCFGREVSLREVRSDIGCGRSGTSGLALLKAARRYRLQARGVRSSRPTCATWRPVRSSTGDSTTSWYCERTVQRGIVVLDPAYRPACCAG